MLATVMEVLVVLVVMGKAQLAEQVVAAEMVCMVGIMKQLS